MVALLWLFLVIGIIIIFFRVRSRRTHGIKTQATAESVWYSFLKVLFALSLSFFLLNLLLLLSSFDAPMHELSGGGLVPQITLGGRSMIRGITEMLVYGFTVCSVIFLLIVNRSYVKAKGDDIFKKRLILTLFILLGVTIVASAGSLGLNFLAPFTKALRFDNSFEGLLHLTVGAIVYLGVVAYFRFWRRQPLSPMARNYFIVGALMLVGMAYAAFILRTVPNQAEFAIDIERSTHIRNVATGVLEYYQSKGQLPVTLDALGPDRTGIQPVDPITGVPYDYRITSEDTYELCATFETDSVYYNPYGRIDLIEHDEGYDCLELNVPPYYRNTVPNPG